MKRPRKHTTKAVRRVTPTPDQPTLTARLLHTEMGKDEEYRTRTSADDEGFVGGFCLIKYPRVAKPLVFPVSDRPNTAAVLRPLLKQALARLADAPTLVLARPKRIQKGGRVARYGAVKTEDGTVIAFAGPDQDRCEAFVAELACKLGRMDPTDRDELLWRFGNRYAKWDKPLRI